MKTRLSAAFLILAAPAVAHRLDEYLQGTILSVERDVLHAQMSLTPGVMVLPAVMAQIGDAPTRAASQAEQRAYAARVLQDLVLSIDGHPLKPRLVSLQFPSVEEMNAGLGQIRLNFDADLPPGGPLRKLSLENHHLSGISAYQVNCLVPRERGIRVAAQRRNYTQSHYELDYEQEISAGRVVWLGGFGLLSLFGLLFVTRWSTTHPPAR
jgi:hypothetical protein